MKCLMARRVHFVHRSLPRKFLESSTRELMRVSIAVTTLSASVEILPQHDIVERLVGRTLDVLRCRVEL